MHDYLKTTKGKAYQLFFLVLYLIFSPVISSSELSFEEIIELTSTSECSDQVLQILNQDQGKEIENVFIKSLYSINCEEDTDIESARRLSSSFKKIMFLNKDTYSNEHLFFSHRRACHKKQDKNGRMINIISFIWDFLLNYLNSDIEDRLINENNCL